VDAVTRLSRRTFVGGVAGLGASAAGLMLQGGCVLAPDRAPPALKIARIGALGTQSRTDSVQNAYWDAFLAGMREHGWVEGQNLVMEWRFSGDTDPERLAALAAELFRLPVDVLVSSSTPSLVEAKKVGSAIPIVMAGPGDPVGAGLVVSLARPGGTVTGVTQFSTQLSAKRLQLLAEVAPGLSRVAVVHNLANAAAVLSLPELRDGARTLGVELLELDARTADQVESAFETARRWPADALYVGNDIFSEHRQRLFTLAVSSRLPTVSTARLDVVAGGLMAFGASSPSLYHRAADYVDKILKGAKPADLPVEQPTTFEFAANLNTAQALGITFPPNVAAQVTEWVQ
jgi:putative ABC transport system substrate-binding protein